MDIDIDLIQLWNTPDYEDVVEAEQVSLCDTVHVFISKLGIEVSSKVTETQYDCLLERYDGITLSNSTVSSRNSSLTTALSNIRNTANEAYNTALRVETSMGEQIGGISVSMVYDGTLLAGLFGLHYQNVTGVNGDTVRYAFNAGSLAKSTLHGRTARMGSLSPPMAVRHGATAGSRTIPRSRRRCCWITPCRSWMNAIRKPEN